MSNAFVKIKMCFVYNQWYDISCATLHFIHIITVKSEGNISVTPAFCETNLAILFQVMT